MQPLDRPVWASLITYHRNLAEGGALARRFLPDVNAFAATVDDSPQAAEALGALVPQGEKVLLAQVAPVIVPAGLVLMQTAMGVQMVATTAIDEHEAETEIVPLGDEDAAAMLALATLTEPGPFLPRTHVMGRFWGVKREGQLIAMAGERMRFPGFTEVSGVCTHPGFRGEGLARRLSRLVAARIQARGETPFLHAWKTNTGAIALYEKLGFRHRSDMHVAELARPASGS